MTDRLSIMTPSMGDVGVLFYPGAHGKNFSDVAVRIVGEEGLRMEFAHTGRTREEARRIDKAKDYTSLPWFIAERPSRGSDRLKAIIGLKPAEDMVDVVQWLGQAIAATQPIPNLDVLALPIDEHLTVIDFDLRAAVLKKWVPRFVGPALSPPVPPVTAWTLRGSLADVRARVAIIVSGIVTGFDVVERSETAQVIVTLWHEDLQQHAGLMGTIGGELSVSLREEILPAGIQGVVRLAEVRQVIDVNADAMLIKRIAAKQKALYG